METFSHVRKTYDKRYKADIDALHSGSVPCELYVDVSNIVSKQLVLPVLVRNLKSGFKVVRIEPEQGHSDSGGVSAAASPRETATEACRLKQ